MQLEFFSPSLRNEISQVLNVAKNGNKEPTRTILELNEPEFDLFDSLSMDVSAESLTIMLNREGLKISELKNVIKLINKSISFFGEANFGKGQVTSDEIQEIANWKDEDCFNITRMWENSFGSNCRVALDFSFEENQILFVILIDF